MRPARVQDSDALGVHAEFGGLAIGQRDLLVRSEVVARHAEHVGAIAGGDQMETNELSGHQISIAHSCRQSTQQVQQGVESLLISSL